MTENTMIAGNNGLTGHRLLRTEVYEYLRSQIKEGNLHPGMFISMNTLMKTLNISRTPLRDALLQLQGEGFVSFLPQRGIQITELTQKDIENLYEILGALESRVLLSVFDRITPDLISKMKEINQQMFASISEENLNTYADLNVAFHSTYISMSSNVPLCNLIDVVRQRLFVFGKKDWSLKMRELNHSEHLEFLRILETGDAIKSADYLRDYHCNYQILKDAENASQ